MSRPTERVALISELDRLLIRSLFGTIPNAFENLGEPIPKDEFVRAMKAQPISEFHQRALCEAWDAWARFFGIRRDVADYRWANMDNPGRLAKVPTNPVLKELQILQRWQE